MNKLETDTAVEFSHMVINALASRERLEADPTSVRVTACARHVVATLRMFNGCIAAWAFLDAMRPHIFLEQTVPSVLTIRAGHALVVFDVARRADARKAGWTG